MNLVPFRHFALAYFANATSNVRTRNVLVPRYGTVTQDGFDALRRTMGLPV
jgi:hypothetical protein